MPKNQKSSGNEIKHVSSRRIIKSFEANRNAQRTMPERIADFLMRKFGTTTFLLTNGLLFFGWIAINFGWVPTIKIFDPFPFSLLTMIVSLQAIFLSIIVLIAQNRSTAIDNLREELDLQVNIIAEQEITKILELLAIVLQKNGIDVSEDQSLRTMLRTTNLEKIEQSIEKQITLSSKTIHINTKNQESK